MINKKLGLLLCCCPFGILSAQHFAQITMGNYAGVHAAKINPALTAGSKYLWHVNLIGLWGNLNSRYIKTDIPVRQYTKINNGDPILLENNNGPSVWNNPNSTEILNGKSVNAFAAAMAYGPSFIFKIKGFSVGLISDATSMARVRGLDEKLAHAGWLKMDTANGSSDLFKIKQGANSESISKTTIATSRWASIGITASYELPLKWQRSIMIGLSLRKLWGLGAEFYQNDAFDVRNAGAGIMQLDNPNFRVGVIDARGSGVGADLGVGYTIRKREYLQNGDYKFKHPDYVARLGFSILDLGSVLYQNVQLGAANGNIAWNSNNAVGKYGNVTPGVPGINTIIADLPGYSIFRQNLRIGQPARMAFTADYQFRKHWFIQGQWVQSLRSAFGISARHPSYFMVGPRYESDLFAFTLPVMLEYDYRAVRAAMSIRLGPIYIGSNSLLSVIKTRGVRDADYFIGIAFGDIAGSWINRLNGEKEEKAKRKKGRDCEKI